MPVLTALNPSIAANIALKKSHHPQHQHQSRRAAAHLKSKAARAAAAAAAVADQPNMGGRRTENLSSEVGKPVPHNVNGRVAASAETVVGAGFPTAADDNYHPGRQPLAPWPAAPQGLPPTPRFAVSEEIATKHHSVSRQATVETGEVVPLARQRGHKAPVKRTAPVVQPVQEEKLPTVFPASPIIEDDIKIIPSPSELLKTANEQARLNAATGLSDWMSDAIWQLCNDATVSTESFVSPSQRRSVPFTSTAVPPPFRRFVSQTIYQVSASPASLMLALWFVFRLPIGLVGSDLSTVDELERAFVEDLSASRRDIPWRLFILGVTLSNKWLEDNTFTTKTWHEVTGLSIASMRSLESKTLALFAWTLGPQPRQWRQWLDHLRRRELKSNVIGAERVSSSTKSPIQVLEDLMAEADAMIIAEPLPTSMSESVTEHLLIPTTPYHAAYPSPEASPTALAPHASNDSTSVAKQRRVEQVLPLFPRVDAPRRLNTPAVWDPSSTALDSPITQPPRKMRPMYEAVQRPAHPAYPLSPPYEQPSYGVQQVQGYPPQADYPARQPAAYYDQQVYGYAPIHTQPQSQYAMISYPTQPQPVPERSWYDPKSLPRSVMGGMASEARGHSAWPTFAGSLRTF